MMTATTTFPEYESAVRDLVAQHRKLKGERVVLAVYFGPQRRASGDVCLFEVIDGFGPGEPESDDGDLFQFGYGSTPGLPLPKGVSLRMVLTNPREFRDAIEKDWKTVAELRAARAAGEAIVLHSDDEGDELWGLLE